LRLDAVKVVDRFPFTEQGWASAWRALANADASAARAVAAELAAREAGERAAATLAALSADSLACLRHVIFYGGSGEAPLTKGQACDLRFGRDRIMVCPPGLADVIVEARYPDVETVDIVGPGQVRSMSAGALFGLVLAAGLVGLLLGALIFRVAGAVLGAVLLAVASGHAGAALTKIETIIRIGTADSELYFLCTYMRPDPLRVELSAPLKAIRRARPGRDG
jgi:hypothetical protein